MNQQLNFDYSPTYDHYPHAPASRATETSRAAARRVSGKKDQCWRDILALLAVREVTPDEASELMPQYHFLYLRPRFTELKKLERIEPTGETRPSLLGNPMDVMRLKR